MTDIKFLSNDYSKKVQTLQLQLFYNPLHTCHNLIVLTAWPGGHRAVLPVVLWAVESENEPLSSISYVHPVKTQVILCIRTF